MMPCDLECTLIIFVSVLTVVVIFVALFLVLWLNNLNKLTISLTQTVDECKNDITPILSEIKTMLAKANEMLNMTTNNFTKARKVILTLLGAASLFMGRCKKLSNGFLKGILQGFGLFFKK